MFELSNDPNRLLTDLGDRHRITRHNTFYVGGEQSKTTSQYIGSCNSVLKNALSRDSVLQHFFA